MKNYFGKKTILSTAGALLLLCACISCGELTDGKFEGNISGYSPTEDISLYPVTGVRAGAPTGSIYIEWNYVSGKSYNIYRAGSAAGIYSKINATPISAASYHDTGVAPETLYFYKVCMVNSRGTEGPWSGYAAAATGAIAVPETYLADALTWIDNNAVSNCEYVITLTSDEYFMGSSLYLNYDKTITITLVGSGENRTIMLTGDGFLFQLYSGVTLILDNNITLAGKGSEIDNPSPLVYVQSGAMLVMNNGSKITNNKNTGNGYAGGGVYVAGTFTMKGGEISGNTASSYGGGVYVDSYGVFRKESSGGVIYGSNESSADLKNTASGDDYGHAVYYNDSSSAKKRNNTVGVNDMLYSDSGEGWE